MYSSGIGFRVVNTTEFRRRRATNMSEAVESMDPCNTTDKTEAIKAALKKQEDVRAT